MITVRVDIADAVKSLDGMQKGLAGALRRGVLKAAQIYEGAVRRTIYDTFKGRTGGLARSFRAALAYSEKTRAAAVVGSDSPYAAVQNDGEPVIRPRTTKSLAVPIGRMRDRAIAPWPRTFPKTGPNALHFIPRKGKPPLLARVSKNRVEPLFVLMRAVKLKGKRYLERALASSLAEINATTQAEVNYLVTGDKP